MERHDVYALNAPNGVTIEAWCVDMISQNTTLGYAYYLMYSQNRLFVIREDQHDGWYEYSHFDTLCDYCLIPEGDKTIKDCNEFAGYPIEVIHINY